MFTVGQKVIINAGVLGPVEYQGIYEGTYTAPGALRNEHLVGIPSKTARYRQVALQDFEFRSAE